MIVVAVFVIDCLSPLGIAAGALYMAAVLSAVPLRHTNAIYFTAGICSLLVLVGWLVSPGSGETQWWKVVANRALDLGVIWVAAGMAEAWSRLQQRRLRQIQEARLLQQATILSASRVSLREALENSLCTLCDILGWPVGHVYLRDRDTGHLVSCDIWQTPRQERFDLLRAAARGLRFAPGKGAPGRVLAEGKPIAVADVARSHDYDWLKEPELLDVRGAFVLPITVGGKTAAVMEFFSDHAIAATPDFITLTQSVSEQLGRLFERRRADERLRQTEERLRLALAGGGMGVYEWHLESDRLVWSPELERICGLEPGTFEGTMDAVLRGIHPEDRDRVAEALRTAVEQRQEHRIEYRLICPDGCVRWLEDRGTIQADTDGAPQRMVGVCMDVTDKKQAEQEMKEAREKAETANRLRSRFVANMSHELRTPMNSILGMLQLALEVQVPPDVRKWLTTAKMSAESLLSLLNDLLDVSKIEVGKLEIQPEPFQLRELLNETARALGVKAFEKRVELLVDVESSLPDRVIGDPGRLRQVLSNLMANAIKFTEQGEVVLTVALVEERSDEAVVRFSVADTGVGISPEDQERIFEPFIQSDTTASRQYGGAGLGLSIAAEIVRHMGGEIRLESQPGKGSRFWFCIPLGADADSELDAPQSHDARLLEGLRVLIVDGNATSGALMGKWLNEWSMCADVAVDGDHAIGKLQRSETEHQAYHLVIADTASAETNGSVLADRMADALAEIPPLILMHWPYGRGTGDTESSAWTRLEKPLSTAQLREAVMRALGVALPASEGRFEPLASSPTARDLSVLMAEDTPANQEVVTSVLRRRGHAVTVVENGREAVDLATKRHFDVVLMDLTMPVMDGYEATAAIRQREKHGGRHVPIIAMTAHAAPEDQERCMAAGMDAYLAKPIDVAKLVRLVESSAEKAVSPARSAPETRLAETAYPQTRARDDGEAGSASIGALSGATHPSEQDADAIDYQGALDRLGGDSDLFRRIIDLFDEDAPGLLQAIREAAAAADPSQLRRAAHSLRGLAANFGAQDAMRSASRLEQMGIAGQVADAGQAITELQREIERLDKALTPYRRVPAVRRATPQP